MKILVAILACHKREAQTDIQRATWMSRGPWESNVAVRIFRGRPHDGICAINHGNDLWLNCDDSYEGMCAKARMVYTYGYLNCFDFVFTLGDDGWVHIPRLVAYCQEIWNHGNPAYDYVGHLRGGDNEFSDDYASGGAGTLFSARAIKVLNLAPDTNDPAEDRWAGNTLRAAGILLHSERRRFCLPAEYFDRQPWEPICIETMRVHRGVLVPMRKIHEEFYDAVVVS